MFLMTLAAACTIPFVSCESSKISKYPESRNFHDGKFENSDPAIQLGFTRSVVISWRFLTKRASDFVPDRPHEIQQLTASGLLAAPDNSLWRLGHSTILLKLDGKFLLTDPVFNSRASPNQIFGPKRFHPSPINLSDLPPIEAVILSHDHYDHLEKAAVTALAPKVQRFITPLGVGDRLVEWGVPSAKIHQLDWWQETEIGRIVFVATPAKHFSGRAVGDRNRTLWASWVLIGPKAKVFFSGDSGYFDAFKKIGERFGPFDITLIEAGAYDKEWPGVHMTPEESVHAHLDLKGRWMVPIHNGTFDLAFHKWAEPFERISTAAANNGVSVLTPRFGDRVNLIEPEPTALWWR